MDHPEKARRHRFMDWLCSLLVPLLLAAAPVVAQSRDAEYEPRTVPDLRTRKSGSDWPHFLGPTHDSKSTERGILTDWPEQGPPIVWQRKVATGYGMPAVSRGRLFQFDRHDAHSVLSCLNSETGKVLWQVPSETKYEDLYSYDNGPRCCPVVDEDRVYTFGVDGLLQCRGVLDGALIWSIETNPRFGVVQNFFGVGSTPIVHGNLLIVQIGGSDAASQRVPPGQLDLVEGNGSGIVAFDKFTGQVRYQLTDELASYSSPVPATIDGRAWCFVFARGGLVGFNPTDGKLDFQFPWRDKGLESVNASNPVVVGNQVFISETYGPGSALLKVRPGGYDVVWSDDPKSRNKSMQTHWNTSIHHDGYLYGSSGRHTNNAELRCVELATGKVMWSVPRTTRSSLLYVDEHLICLTEMGDLVLLKTNPEKPEVVAAVSPRLPADDEDAQEEEATEPIAGIGPPKLLRYPAWAAPILSHGLLYLRGKDRLVCMELIRPKQ